MSLTRYLRPNRFLELQTYISNCPLNSSSWWSSGNLKYYIPETEVPIFPLKFTLPLDIPLSINRTIPPVTQIINLEILHDFSFCSKLAGLNQGVGQATFLLEALGENLLLSFPAFRYHLHSLASGPFLHFQIQ